MNLKALATSSVLLFGCDMTSEEDRVSQIATSLQGALVDGETQVCSFDRKIYFLDEVSTITANISEAVIQITVESPQEIVLSSVYEIREGVLTQVRLTRTSFGGEPQKILHTDQDGALNLLLSKAKKILLAVEAECRE